MSSKCEKIRYCIIKHAASRPFLKFEHSSTCFFITITE